MPTKSETIVHAENEHFVVAPATAIRSLWTVTMRTPDSDGVEMHVELAEAARINIQDQDGPGRIWIGAGAGLRGDTGADKRLHIDGAVVPRAGNRAVRTRVVGDCRSREDCSS